MMDLHENENTKEAEKLAHLLLSHATLPIMYRAFAEMVSSGHFTERFGEEADCEVGAGVWRA